VAAGGEAGEILLCDTSYVSQIMKAARRPETTDHWPADVVARIDRALLTVSVITVAEMRMGMIKAGWGDRARSEAEHRLVAYTWIPLDLEIIDTWAELTAGGSEAGLWWRKPQRSLDRSHRPRARIPPRVVRRGAVLAPADRPGPRVPPGRLDEPTSSRNVN
jgi:predicted nucleic acid-binding protein